MALIDQILERYEHGDRDKRAVLGTVVDLRGSGYRRPGARILIDEAGGYVGAISGGCLEKDAARHARTWVEHGPQTVLFDTRASQFHPLGAYGTGCEGVVHLFLQPLPVHSGLLDPLAILSELRDSNDDGVLVTAYDASDAYSGRLGAVAFRTTHDIRWSSRFPEHLRRRVLRAANTCLEDRTTRGLHFEDAPSGLRLLLEYVRPRTELVVIGTGRDAAALVNVARGMNWRIRVVGTDPGALKANAFRQVDTTLVEGGTRADLELTRHSHVIQMTHDFELDTRLLPRVLSSSAAYIGLLGPRRRTARLLADLHATGKLADAQGGVDAVLERVSAPVGLDLGGEDPYEVAVSIIAEVVAHKNGRSGGALSERSGAIHEQHRVISVRQGAS
ncbi:MAG: XdhC family protein [Myxococcota bacterium]